MSNETNAHLEQDELLEGVFPETPQLQTRPAINLTEPWYRPAKQFIRRYQWNSDILHLLNQLTGASSVNESQKQVLKYVGLPGKHYLDLLSMGAFCHSKHVLIEYIGFRTGPSNQEESLSDLPYLSNQTHYTRNSITLPDNIEVLAEADSPALRAFKERGPYDVVNLDVCGGVLHGPSQRLLRTLTTILDVQCQRKEPWLLFLTTTAKASDIGEEILAKFLGVISSNCRDHQDFLDALDAAAKRCGIVDWQHHIKQPGSAPQDCFVCLFSLALGKWLLKNLHQASPIAVPNPRSAYRFRNTDRDRPEMLSLSYLVNPVLGVRSDPTGVLNIGNEERNYYAECAVEIITSSMDGMLDLDEEWERLEERKQSVVKDCLTMFASLGVAAHDLKSWLSRHRLDERAEVRQTHEDARS